MPGSTISGTVSAEPDPGRDPGPGSHVSEKIQIRQTPGAPDFPDQIGMLRQQLDEFRDALFWVWEHNPFFIQVSESMPGRRLRLPPICHLPAQGHTDKHNPYLKGFVVRGGCCISRRHLTAPGAPQNNFPVARQKTPSARRE
jgi:hypothetical protein